MKNRFFAAALISTMCLIAFSSEANDDWKSFQNGGSNVNKAKSLPTKWDTEKGIKWSIDLASYGQSSPIVDGNLIYLTSVSGGMKDTFHLMAIDKKSGKVLWKKNIQNSTPEKSSVMISRAAPSPVCDTNGVIAFFEGGNLVAYSKEGKLRWELDLVKKYGAIKARHGIASSLEQDQKHVFAWVERSESPYLVAIEKKSGEVVWKSEGLGVTTWSSPRLVPVGSAHHLVISGIGKIAGYDPATGNRLWTFDKIAGNSTPTPIPVGNGKFLIGASTGRGEQSSGDAAKSNGLIEIKEVDGKFSASFVWQADEATSSFGSPLAYNGNAYFVNRVGVLYCLDLETGKQIYAGRTKSSIWATPVGVGEDVYLFGKDGTTTVIDAGKTFQKKSTNPLWKSASGTGESSRFGGAVLYAGVVSDQSLILRRGDRLYCIE